MANLDLLLVDLESQAALPNLTDPADVQEQLSELNRAARHTVRAVRAHLAASDGPDALLSARRGQSSIERWRDVDS